MRKIKTKEQKPGFGKIHFKKNLESQQKGGERKKKVKNSTQILNVWLQRKDRKYRKRLTFKMKKTLPRMFKIQPVYWKEVQNDLSN